MSEGSVMGLRFRARVRFEGSGPEVRPKSILGSDSVGVVLGVRIRVNSPNCSYDATHVQHKQRHAQGAQLHTHTHTHTNAKKDACTKTQTDTH